MILTVDSPFGTSQNEKLGSQFGNAGVYYRCTDTMMLYGNYGNQLDWRSILRNWILNLGLGEYMTDALLQKVGPSINWGVYKSNDPTGARVTRDTLQELTQVYDPKYIAKHSRRNNSRKPLRNRCNRKSNCNLVIEDNICQKIK